MILAHWVSRDFAMKLWAKQNGCFNGANAGGIDNGILLESYLVGANTARRYDLSGHGAACGKYQLILVENGGHMIQNQQQRIWSFLKRQCLASGS